MSDKDFDITAIDSLMNLTGKTDEELTALISELGLSFSPDFLREIHKCLSAEQITPSYELLFFFDAIFSASRKDIKNVKISDVTTADKEVMLSFRDVQKKAEYLGKGSDLQLSDILKISSEYLTTLDIKAPETARAGEDLVISDESGKTLISLGLDEKSLPYGYVKENEKAIEAEQAYLPEGFDIFLVSSDDTRLTESEEFSALKVAQETIGEKGLLFTLLKMCYGAEINAAVLPSLPALVSGFCGDRIVALQSYKREILTALAEGYGITVTKVASSLSLPTARILTSDGEINIRTGFLRRLFSFEERLSLNIPSAQITPTKYEKLSHNALAVSNHIVSARYTKELSFASGMNAVIDSLFAILARGADRRGAGITIKIGVRRENISDGVGALLGTYRAIMELCLPEINSEVEFSDEDCVFCTAFARAGKQDLTETSGQSKFYLLSFSRLDNSLPAFCELRYMCDRILRIINGGEAISVRAINGTISAATYDIPITYESNISRDTVAQGFIIEAKPDAKINAPLIGVLTNENNNTEETL